MQTPSTGRISVLPNKRSCRVGCLETSLREILTVTVLRHLRELFVLAWTALWLYLSLGMVIVSFSAIQFQTSVSEDARREALANSDKPVTFFVTVAHIQ